MRNKSWGMVLGGTIVLGALASACEREPATEDEVYVASLSSVEEAQFVMTNEARLEEGLAPLEFDLSLAAVIEEHLQELCGTGDFSHTGAAGTSPGDRIHQARLFFTAAGENLAEHVNSAEKVTAGWMRSEPHRKNILGPWFRSRGVQYEACPDADGKARHLWGQLFTD